MTTSSDNGQKRTLDWEDIRQRIVAANAALTKLDEISPEMLQQVWARRAALLAQALPQEDEAEQIELVLVRLGREVYGLDAQYVFSIKPAELITRVPRVPDWVTGVVNLRGRILSVIDLRRYFGLPPVESEGNEGNNDGKNDHDVPRMPAERTDHLVVVQTPDMEIALLADEVLAVKSVPVSHIQDATGTVRGLRPEYVRGIVAQEDGATDDPSPMFVVLDLPAMLADERLIVHEDVI